MAKKNRKQEIGGPGTMKKKFVCIICPQCCELETDGSEVVGAHCKKGVEFARQEAILPLRVITTTIRYKRNGLEKMIPVKTACPVPLPQIHDIMRQIKKVRLAEIPAIGSRITVPGDSEPLELIVTGE